MHTIMYNLESVLGDLIVIEVRHNGGGVNLLSRYY